MSSLLYSSNWCTAVSFFQFGAAVWMSVCMGLVGSSLSSGSMSGFSFIIACPRCPVDPVNPIIGSPIVGRLLRGIRRGFLGLFL